jgi:hypothetical protein
MAQLDSDKMLGQLLAQREAKQAATEQPAPAAPAAPAKAKPATTSKRGSWMMRAWYVQPETASRLRAYVNRQQESGSSIDASEVVDQAIAAWLDQQGT